MISLGQGCLILVTVSVIVSIDHGIKCTADDDVMKAGSPKKTKSIPRTLNYFDKLLPKDISLEDKCKRYAVVISMSESGGLFYATTIEKISALPEDVVNKHYKELGPKKLSALYMSAVDKYRTSHLAPPFLDLIECLTRIDEPLIAKYLDNEELKTTIFLYRQALNSPDKRIDLSNFDLNNFHITYQINLKTILGDHLKGSQGPVPETSDHEPSINQQEPDLDLNKNQQREWNKVLRLLQLDHLQSPEIDSPEDTSHAPPAPRRARRIVDEEELLARKRRKRIRERDRERRKRQEDPLRYREQERLRQQRRRLLNPTAFDKRLRQSQLNRSQKLREERRDRQRREYEQQQEQLKRLERQMQLQSEQRVQQQEQSLAVNSPQPFGLVGTYQVPGQGQENPASPSFLSSISHYQELLERMQQRDQQSQLQLQQQLQPEGSSGFDLFSGLDSGPSSLNAQAKSIPNYFDNSRNDQHLQAPPPHQLHFTDPALLLLPGLPQPERWTYDELRYEPSHSIPVSPLTLSLHPLSSPSFTLRLGQTGSSQTQYGQSYDLYPTPLGGLHDASIEGQADDSDQQSLDMNRYLNQSPGVGGSVFDSDTSDPGNRSKNGQH